MRYTVRVKGSDAVVAESPESGAEFTLRDGHLLKVRLAHACTGSSTFVCVYAQVCLQGHAVDALMGGSSCRDQALTGSQLLGHTGHVVVCVQAFGVALKTMKKGEEAALDISPACAPLTKPRDMKDQGFRVCLCSAQN